jgi:hypothetical protein
MSISRLALMALLAFGCAESNESVRGPKIDEHTMTKEIIAREGTRAFAAPLKDVVKATAATLAQQGYEIAAVFPERGTITTARRLIRVGGGGGLIYYRTFVVKISEVPSAKLTKVTALPKIFENDFDISDKPIWDMRGEAKIWGDLFKSIGEVLGESPAPAPAAASTSEI